jgi:hypothetical protein
MTVQPKKRGRPRKVIPQPTLTPPSEEVVQESQPIPSRQEQWDMLDDSAKKVLQLSEKEFLSQPDVTGFGPGAYFTPPDKR